MPKKRKNIFKYVTWCLIWGMQKPSTVQQSKSTSSTTFIQEFVNIRLKNVQYMQNLSTIKHYKWQLLKFISRAHQSHLRAIWPRNPFRLSKYQQSMCYRRHQHRQKCDFCTPQIPVPTGTYTIKLINLSQFLRRLHVFCVKQNSCTSLGLLAKIKCSICSY